MSRLDLGSALREVAAVIGEAGSTQADAVRVAIYLEDALDIVLPDDLITPGHLGTVDAVARTLAALGVG